MWSTDKDWKGKGKNNFKQIKEHHKVSSYILFLKLFFKAQNKSKK